MQINPHAFRGALALGLAAFIAGSSGCAQTSTTASVKGVAKITGNGPTDPSSPLSLSSEGNQPVQSPTESVTSANLNAAQAIDAAKAFCQTAGVDVTGAESAMFTGLHAPGDISYRYWKPVWEVSLGTASVEICDTDGVVTGFDAGTGGKAKPGGAPMSREAALARGDQIVKASHVTESLGEPSAAVDTKLSGSVWAIDWPREAQGRAFADQQVSVTLDQTSGTLKSLAVAFDTPPPGPARPVLTEEEAVRKAEDFLESRTKHPSDLWVKKKTALIWVTPKSFGATAKVRAPLLTWRCSFTNTTNDYADIPVDAVTSEIVTSALNYNQAE